jgi:hypothetical protein
LGINKKEATFWERNLQINSGQEPGRMAYALARYHILLNHNKLTKNDGRGKKKSKNKPISA